VWATAAFRYVFQCYPALAPAQLNRRHRPVGFCGWHAVVRCMAGVIWQRPGFNSQGRLSFCTPTPPRQEWDLLGLFRGRHPCVLTGQLCWPRAWLVPLLICLCVVCHARCHVGCAGGYCLSAVRGDGPCSCQPKFCRNRTSGSFLLVSATLQLVQQCTLVQLWLAGMCMVAEVPCSPSAG
jgi:hypothetical protein